jgi:hypothetical protein
MSTFANQRGMMSFKDTSIVMYLYLRSSQSTLHKYGKLYVMANYNNIC